MIFNKDLSAEQIDNIEKTFQAIQYWYPEFAVINLPDLEVDNDPLGILTVLKEGQTYFQALANPEKKMLLVLTKVRLNRETREFYSDPNDPHWLFLARASVNTDIIEVMPKSLEPLGGNFTEVPIDPVSYPHFYEHYRLMAKVFSEASKLVTPDRMKIIDQVDELDFGLAQGVFLARTTMAIQSSDWLHILKLAYALHLNEQE